MTLENSGFEHTIFKVLIYLSNNSWANYDKTSPNRPFITFSLRVDIVRKVLVLCGFMKLLGILKSNMNLPDNPEDLPNLLKCEGTASCLKLNVVSN